MITGELKNKIDSLWEIFWTGGLTNPLDVIEQMTYLMFIRDLDDADNLRMKESAMLGLPYQSVFAESVKIGEHTIPGNQLKWSVFHDFPRSYPYGSLYAHVVGYDSQGKSGLESTENFELLTSNAFFLEKLRNEFQDEKNIGDTVVTTLDTSLQQAAYNALGDNKGAVVILEPTTGLWLVASVKKSPAVYNIRQGLTFADYCATG